MPFTPPVDGPPPSPATDPAAAQEVGRPGPAQPPGASAGLAKPLQMQGSGPDLSGVLTLGQKLVEGALSLAQAVPVIAGEMAQVKELIMTALGKIASQSPGNGSMPGPNPQGQVVTQAGPQFPGGGQGAGKPF
jgi:hypothetical protein